MMLKPSIDTLLDKVPSKYSLCIEAQRLEKEEEERKIKEQIAKEKEEGEKI